MPTIWLTYSWDDNRDRDVDYVAQELEAAGARVDLDRWTVRAGIRLWEQIEKFIGDPSRSDAWAIYATQASLGSQACKEEYAYALDRALRSRGESFPIVAIFPGTVDADLIPAGIRTRLHVGLRDPDWKERVVAAADGRVPTINRQPVHPYSLKVHRHGEYFTFEVRPRAGAWCPFVAGVPVAEAGLIQLLLTFGAAGKRPRSSIVTQPLGLPTGDRDWAYEYADNEATPTMSYFIQCAGAPSKLLFGVREGQCHVVSNPAAWSE